MIPAWRKPGGEQSSAGGKYTQYVSLYLGPWAFYQLPIKGMPGEVCGCVQHNFHLPGVEALAAQESEVPSAQRTCRQEPGELLVNGFAVCNFYFKRSI